MTQPGTVPGAVLELHAARAHLGLEPGRNEPLTTQWWDMSGHGNHGTLIRFGAAPWSASGLSFDRPESVTQYVNIPVSDSLPGDIFSGGQWSVEMWALKPSGAPSGNIVRGRNGHRPRLNWTSTGVLSLNSNVGGVYTHLLDSLSLPFGVLVHSVTQQDGSRNRIYTNGTARESVYQAIDGPSTGLVLGNNNVAAENFLGSATLLRLYPFALTPEQIAQNYAAGPVWSVPPHLARTRYIPQEAVHVP